MTDLLESVADGAERVVLESATGRRAVLMAESELHRLEALARERPGTAHRRIALTRRELDVLELAARGLQGSDIARSLGMAPNTVAQHLAAVRRKYGVRTSAAAVDLAREDGHLR